MKSALIFISFLIASFSALPVKEETTISGYSLDVSQPLTNSSIMSFSIDRYAGIIVRVFETNTTSFDKSMLSTLNNAIAYHSLRIEAFMAPTMFAKLSGSEQFDVVANNFRNNSIGFVNTVYISVNDTKLFSTNTTANSAFIESIVTRGMQLKYNVGIFTNSKLWKKITDNYDGLDGNVRLWYWANNGEGIMNEGAPNFNDFKSFGNWAKPDIKQFAKNEMVDGAKVNRNVFAIRKN
ncbi:unnamed protein product [Caenorhabditis angaria]|uniref:Uncharacterized protein n=1 Tax=Caenorhabditis angaria TaxID=860376 RepID=A0A9P1N2E8_9PELO|nr:unnamed protein product [Caenorhabditis angaria]